MLPVGANRMFGTGGAGAGGTVSIGLAEEEDTIIVGVGDVVVEGVGSG
jgi:hypothetical protein